MRAVAKLVESHRRRIAAELQDALWNTGAGFRHLGREQTLFVVHRMIDALVRDISDPREQALRYLLREHLSGRRAIAAPALFGALLRLGQALRELLFHQLDDPEMLALASSAIDRAITSTIESSDESTVRVDPPPADPERREPTILRNIDELLREAHGEVVECSVLSVALRDPSLENDGHQVIRDALHERLEPLGVRVVVDEPTLVCGCMTARVDDSDVAEALSLAVSLARSELFASCSMGIARGPVMLATRHNRLSALGEPIQHSMAMALRGAKRKVLVDPRVHALSDSSYVFRSFGDRVFELDGDQPQWIDRWEEAALVVDPDLVGREDVLAEVNQVLTTARVAVVGLRGKAGHGRRSVALAALHARGVDPDRIYETRTHFVASEPYWSIIVMLRELLGLRDEPLERSALRRVLSPLGAEVEAIEPTLCALLSVETDDELPPEELDQSSFRATIASALRTVLEAVATTRSGRPLAVVVHDAHRLDASSAQALGQVVDTFGGESPLYLVLTYKGRLRASGALSKALREVSLPPLSTEATLEIARHMLDCDTLDPPFANLIRARSKGSPMLTATLIRYLVETGALKRTDGEWRLSDLFDERSIPRQLKKLLEARIAHLPVKLASLLQGCATLGEPVSQRSLELIWVSKGWNLEALRQSVGLLVEMGFAVSGDDGTVSLAHPSVRQVAYTMQNDVERSEYHRLALVAYRERYPNATRQIPTLMLAHATEARELDTAREAAVEAARRAVQLRDFRAGLSAVERGLAVLDQLDRDSPLDRFDLIAAAELIHDAKGQRDEQKSAIEHMVALAERANDRRRRALSLHRAARLNLLLGQPAKAHALADRALAEARDGDPLDLSNVLRTVALIRWQRNDPSGAVAALREALSIYETLGHARGMGYVLHNLGVFALDTGATQQARSYLERALSQKQRTDDGRGRAAVLDALGQVALNEGRADAAAGAFEAALAIRVAHGDDQGATATRIMLSEALVATNPTRAANLASTALGALRRGNSRARAEASLVLARARHLLGERDSASRLAARAVKSAEEVGAPVLRIRALLTQVELDLSYSTSRRLDRAKTSARMAAEAAEAMGAVRWRVEALSLLALALSRREDPGSAEAAQTAMTLLEERSVVGIDADSIRARCGPLVAAPAPKTATEAPR